MPQWPGLGDQQQGAPVSRAAAQGEHLAVDGKYKGILVVQTERALCDGALAHLAGYPACQVCTFVLRNLKSSSLCFKPVPFAFSLLVTCLSCVGFNRIERFIVASGCASRPSRASSVDRLGRGRSAEAASRMAKRLYRWR